MNETPILKAEQITSVVNHSDTIFSSLPDYRYERKLSLLSQVPKNIPTPAILSSEKSDCVTLKNPSPINCTLQESISKCVGHYAICEFVIADNFNVREGILHEVGQNYLVLYNESNDAFITCDFHFMKFITFYKNGSKVK